MILFVCNITIFVGITNIFLEFERYIVNNNKNHYETKIEL